MGGSYQKRKLNRKDLLTLPSRRPVSSLDLAFGLVTQCDFCKNIKCWCGECDGIGVSGTCELHCGKEHLARMKSIDAEYFCGAFEYIE